MGDFKWHHFGTAGKTKTRSATQLRVFIWWPQRDSNPCFSLERAVSWASRRWGRAGETRQLAGRGGLEPPLRGPEPRVLPLDDLPTLAECTGRPSALSRRGVRGQPT